MVITHLPVSPSSQQDSCVLLLLGAGKRGTFVYGKVNMMLFKMYPNFGIAQVSIKITQHIQSRLDKRTSRAIVPGWLVGLPETKSDENT